MDVKYGEASRSENSLSYYILNEDTKQIGTVEGYATNDGLIAVLHIDNEYQGKGIGYAAFKKVYDELCEQTTITRIIGSWHKDDEFSYCEDGMSTNLRLYQENSEKGLSKEESAFGTPTGKWAKKLGFNKCQIESCTDEDVKVVFYK